MADFSVEDIDGFEYSDETGLYYKLQDARENFVWWCLGHNFDVVATILTMSSLSWSKGFDAGIAIADFSNKPEYAYAGNSGPVQLRPYPADRGSCDSDGGERICD